MKLRGYRKSAMVLACLLVGCAPAAAWAEPAAGDTPPPLGTSPTPLVDGSTPPTSENAPANPGKGVKKPKPPRDPNAPPRPVKVKKIKVIPFPLPIDNTALNAIIPENGLDGKLLSKIMSLKLTRKSNEIVTMEGTTMDLNHPDGKTDFHIHLPTSTFNLETHIITSDEPVTVSTSDFELTGEKMEFNTVDRTGRLIGHVHMIIHNFKQVAGLQPAPTP